MYEPSLFQNILSTCPPASEHTPGASASSTQRPGAHASVRVRGRQRPECIYLDTVSLSQKLKKKKSCHWKGSAGGWAPSFSLCLGETWSTSPGATQTADDAERQGGQAGERLSDAAPDTASFRSERSHAPACRARARLASNNARHPPLPPHITLGNEMRKGSPLLGRPVIP